MSLSYVEMHKYELQKAINVLKSRIASNEKTFRKALGSRELFQAIKTLISFTEKMLEKEREVEAYKIDETAISEAKKVVIEQRRVWYAFKLIQSYSQLKFALLYGINNEEVLKELLEKFKKTVNQIRSRLGVDTSELDYVTTLLTEKVLTKKPPNKREVYSMNDSVVAVVYKVLNLQ